MPPDMITTGCEVTAAAQMRPTLPPQDGRGLDSSHHVPDRLLILIGKLVTPSLAVMHPRLRIYYCSFLSIATAIPGSTNSYPPNERTDLISAARASARS
jgi:hypothetical protein